MSKSHRRKIVFYGANAPYFEFSNAAAAFPIRIEGALWPTVEHYMAARRFDAIGQTHRCATIRRLATPELATIYVRAFASHTRSDWRERKDELMRQALRAKFTQHARLYRLLMATQDARLVSKSTPDSYWSAGADGQGANRLGRMLMRLRTSLMTERLNFASQYFARNTLEAHSTCAPHVQKEDAGEEEDEEEKDEFSGSSVDSGTLDGVHNWEAATSSNDIRAPAPLGVLAESRAGVGHNGCHAKEARHATCRDRLANAFARVPTTKWLATPGFVMFACFAMRLLNG